MRINLAKTLVESFKSGATYISESFVIREETPLDVFAKFEAQRSQRFSTRFFWKTPDGKTSFIGLGEVAFFAAEQIRNQRLEDISYSYQGSPTLLFGGFPFDEQRIEAPLWGDLAKGGFVLPQILLVFSNDCSHAEVIVTSRRKETYDSMKKFFEEEKRTIQKILEEKQRNASHPLPKVIEQKEQNVSEWMASVNQAVETIKNQESLLEKIVLARQLSIEVDTEWSIATILHRLSEQQPNTYLYLLERSGHAFIGATPERLLSATKSKWVTAAVAGSIARGASIEEDEKFANELLHSTKNTQEHQIVVNRIVNEMQAFIHGEIRISKRQILKNRDIQHLYATIQGNRKEGWSFIDMLLHLHPTPALGGEPKREAMSWIRTHESIGRGMYGAPIGWFSLIEDGGEFAVGIRSAVIKKNHALLYAGCGIVADSIASQEKEETSIKFEPMKRGILSDVTSKNHD